MKKLFVFCLSVLCVMISAASSFAGNTFSVNNQAGVTVGTVSVRYTDNTTGEFTMGNASRYQYDIGTRVVASVTISSSTIGMGETKTIIVDNTQVGASVTSVRIDQQKLDNILNLIR